MMETRISTASLTHFSGTYDPADVCILLKPSTIAPIEVAEKEAFIQSGERHYSEMLSPEKVPNSRYMRLYHEALIRNAGRLRNDIESLAKSIASRPETSETCIIASLARAGTPIGILLKRALERLGISTFHYSISIIRGRGIDHTALRHIHERHGAASTIFVDGWTGKGAIKGELERTLKGNGLGFQPYLAVVADPAGRADLAATVEDYVIPSGLLNGIVSGLISRSVLNDAVVGPEDFHACVFQEEHAEHDISKQFLEAVEAAEIPLSTSEAWTPSIAEDSHARCLDLIETLVADNQIDNLNRIKPGIAEATRAILRRVPDMIYVRDLDDPEVQHIIHLGTQAGVTIVERDLHNYRAVTIIKKIGGEQE